MKWLALFGWVAVAAWLGYRYFCAQMTPLPALRPDHRRLLDTTEGAYA